MNTERLIDRLATDLKPARPLASPWVRATWWLLGAIIYLSAITLLTASPAEVSANGGNWLSLAYQVMAILTAVTAAGAALGSTVPGYSGRGVRLAALLVPIWFGSLAVGAVEESTAARVSLAAPGEIGCVATITLGGVLPALVLGYMLRRGAPLAPTLTLALTALASTSVASVAACLSHPHPSEAVTLVWHGMTILVLVSTAAYIGPAILRWQSARFD